MDPLTYARAQMGMSLSFHIVFAAAGICLPVLMVVADVLHRRSGDPEWLELSKRLAKGTAILFAVGAVSGTVLSMELGLLWPGFMERFGDAIGLPFALEGYAFFTEAIFLGLYLYGRDKIAPRLHLFSGIMVAVSGAASAFFVTLVNAFMNVPRGGVMQGGRLVDVDPLAAMFDGPWVAQVVHVLLASYQSVAFAMAGLHAFMMLRYGASTFHRRAMSIALVLACVTAIVQPISGDFSAKSVATHQPWKLAAMEAQFKTEKGAPLRIGGWPDEEAQETRGAIEIPGALSFLGHGDFGAEVRGLDVVPRNEWPPVLGTHLAFQLMVGTGSAMALLALVTALLAWRKRALPTSRWFLWAWVLSAPLGIIAMEAGWFVTELGRQPFIVRGVMRTEEAVTPFPHLAAPFWMFTLVYLFLSVMVAFLLKRQLFLTRPGAGHAG